MRKILLLIIISVLAFGCDKDDSKRCEGLRIAVQNGDVAMVKNIVNRLASDLHAQVSTATDPDGHHNTYLTLIDRLNNECDVNAVGVCYACIDINPVTSEIKLTIPLGTGWVTRIIDLALDGEGRLVCTGMHE
ncbi:MAG TPA: hypothetical protein VHN59_02470 [Chitinophagaceae bacterium]|nr:hypothetical protein [Chitinophagaceae bacterium]